MNSKFYCNKDCEYFPCHKGADEENFNCLFCYCPLFALGDKCGGNFRFTKQGLKDCSQCTVPHDPANYERIVARCGGVMKIAQKRRSQPVRRFIWSIIPALIALAACVILPVLALMNLWRITELMDIPEVTQVIVQLKDAVYIPGWLPAALCAAVTFGVAWLLHRHKIIACILMLIIILLGVVAALLFTHVNGVPMHVVAQIVLEYVSLGAF